MKRTNQRKDMFAVVSRESHENEKCCDDQDIKVHRLRIDGADPLALFVELLRKL